MYLKQSLLFEKYYFFLILRMLAFIVCSVQHKFEPCCEDRCIQNWSPRDGSFLRYYKGASPTVQVNPQPATWQQPEHILWGYVWDVTFHGLVFGPQMPHKRLNMVHVQALPFDVWRAGEYKITCQVPLANTRLSVVTLQKNSRNGRANLLTVEYILPWERPQGSGNHKRSFSGYRIQAWIEKSWL